MCLCFDYIWRSHQKLFGHRLCHCFGSCFLCVRRIQFGSHQCFPTVEIFCVWNSWRSYCVEYVKEAQSCHRNGLSHTIWYIFFFDFCRRMFYVLVGFVAGNSAHNVFLQCFCFCDSAYWRVPTVLSVLVGGCCHSGAAGWKMSLDTFFLAVLLLLFLEC